MYEQQFKELGITDNEIKIYLLLLKEGMINPSQISQKLGLHRGYVYDALERMKEKQIVNSTLENNKKYFQATSPENLAELLRLKLENFRKIIPDLIKINESKDKETKIEIYKGKKIYRILFKDILSVLKKGDEVLLIGINEDLLSTEVEPIYLEQYLNEIESNNISEKIIIKKGSKMIKRKNLQYKRIDEKYIGKTAQIVYNNKVALFILDNPYYLIIIDNKEIAETYKKQFNLLWKIAKK